jgi:GMP synthase PP-ATPase subunit
MTATYLVHKAVGDKLIGVFIDDRFRREGEPKFIVRTLKSLGITLKQLIQRKSFSRLFREKQMQKRSLLTNANKKKEKIDMAREASSKGNINKSRENE